MRFFHQRTHLSANGVRQRCNHPSSLISDIERRVLPKTPLQHARKLLPSRIPLIEHVRESFPGLLNHKGGSKGEGGKKLVQKYNREQAKSERTMYRWVNSSVARKATSNFSSSAIASERGPTLAPAALPGGGSGGSASQKLFRRLRWRRKEG